MKKLNTIGIIGLGALGVMYAWHLTGALGRDAVVAIADRARLDRYEAEGLFFNGEKCDFHYVDIDRPGDGPAVDLLKAFGLSAEHIVEVAQELCK